MTESGPPLAYGDIVCLSISIRGDHPERPLGEIQQLRLGAGAQPSLEQELVGQHVGATGQFERVADPSGALFGVAPLTSLATLLPEAATGILDQGRFDTPWEFIEADPDRVAAEFFVDADRVADIQTDVARELEERQLVTYEVLEAYRRPANQWPQLHGGPAHQSYSANANPAQHASWQVEIGETITAQPAVCNGTIFCTTYEGTLSAIDASTESVRWTRSIDDALRTSPVVVDETVYVAGQSLAAVEASAGDIRWRRTITEADGAEVRSSPAVADETVFVGSPNGQVYAVDAANGTVRWTFDTDGAVHAAPTVTDSSVYVSGTDGAVYALEMETGDCEWRFEFNSRDAVAPVSSVTVRDGTVYKTDGTHLYAIDASTGETDFSTAEITATRTVPVASGKDVILGGRKGGIQVIDPTDGTITWKYPTYGGIHVSPAVSESIVYAVSKRGIVHAIDRQTETQRWTHEFDGDFSTAPALAGGIVYIGTRDGTLYALDGDTGDIQQTEKERR